MNRENIIYFVAGVALAADPDSPMVQLLMRYYHIKDADMEVASDEVMSLLQVHGLVRRR